MNALQSREKPSLFTHCACDLVTKRAQSASKCQNELNETNKHFAPFVKIQFTYKLLVLKNHLHC